MRGATLSRSGEFRVDADIRKAQTLPSRAFADPAFLDLELETLFRKTWLLLPEPGPPESGEDSRSLAEKVRLRGSCAPAAVLGQPLFLQRDWKGGLHCFPNVCTHAWYPLVSGPARHKIIVCGQHGRQFDCEGRFTAQPGFQKANGFPRSCDNLRDLSLEAWGDLLFAALGRPAAPWRRFLGPTLDTTPKLPPRLRRRPLADQVREVPGNWKQHAWNFMDKFHITFIHRAPGGLADALELSSYKTELHPFSSLQWVYAKRPEHGFDPGLLPGRFRDPSAPQKRVFALWWFVFPNLALSCYPWGVSVNQYLPVPGSPDRTLFTWYHHVRDEKAYARKDEIWLDRQVDEEDIDAMSQAGRGARSGFAPRGRFSPSEETGPHWFHRLVYRMVFH